MSNTILYSIKNAGNESKEYRNQNTNLKSCTEKLKKCKHYALNERYHHTSTIQRKLIFDQIAKVLDVSIAELYDCIDNSPANQEELRDQKIIWKYSRNTIVAGMLLLFSCLCLFPARSFLFSSRKEAVYEVLGIIFLFFTIFLFILSIIVAVLEFIYLRQFSRLKYDRSAYKRALKIYSIIFLITLLLTSIADIIILFSE